MKKLFITQLVIIAILFSACGVIEALSTTTESGVNADGVAWTFRGNVNGTGRMEWEDGWWYEGEFSRGDITGQGVERGYFIIDGVHDWWTFTGEFLESDWHGFGRLEYDDGWWQEGEFSQSALNGQGVERGYDESDDGKDWWTYTGGFLYDQWHGSGRLEYDSGEFIEGTWQYGEFVSTVQK